MDMHVPCPGCLSKEDAIEIVQRDTRWRTRTRVVLLIATILLVAGSLSDLGIRTFGTHLSFIFCTGLETAALGAAIAAHATEDRVMKLMLHHPDGRTLLERGSYLQRRGRDLARSYKDAHDTQEVAARAGILPAEEARRLRELCNTLSAERHVHAQRVAELHQQQRNCLMNLARHPHEDHHRPVHSARP